MAEGDDPGKFHPCRHKAGSAETCQPPQGIRGFSALSLSDMASTGPAPVKKGNFFYISPHRKAGRTAGGRAHLGEGGFLLGWGEICAALPLEKHIQTWNNENKKNWWISLLSAPLHLCPMWSVLSHSQQFQQPGSQHVHQTTVLYLLKEPTPPWYYI